MKSSTTVKNNFFSTSYFYESAITILMLIFLLLFIALIYYDHTNSLSQFTTIFLGIIIQAFPFLLIGTILSAVIDKFISPQLIEKFLSKNGPLRIPAIMLCAFLFPVCDCAVVPVAARLAKKNLPVSSVIIFMLSAPIINPIVILSTWYAFPANHNVLLIRLAGGIIIPVSLGLMLEKIFPAMDNILRTDTTIKKVECCHHCHDEKNSIEKKRHVTHDLTAILSHAGTELINIAPYIIVGCIISAIFQCSTTGQSKIIEIAGGNIILQTSIMTMLAFLLSVCSTSDAFIARGFLGRFSLGPVSAFIIAGPMIDIKNVLMMSAYFQKRFIVYLIAGVLLLTIGFTAVLSVTILGSAS